MLESCKFFWDPVYTESTFDFRTAFVAHRDRFGRTVLTIMLHNFTFRHYCTFRERYDIHNMENDERSRVVLRLFVLYSGELIMLADCELLRVFQILSLPLGRLSLFRNKFIEWWLVCTVQGIIFWPINPLWSVVSCTLLFKVKANLFHHSVSFCLEAASSRQSR